MKNEIYLSNKNMKQINWNDFQTVELRVGTIIDVQDFPEARVPAYKIIADFGKEIGIKKSSAKITVLYSKEDLMNKQIIGVINFPPKQIGPFISEFLITGFIKENGEVILAVPDKELVKGSKLA